MNKNGDHYICPDTDKKVVPIVYLQNGGLAQSCLGTQLVSVSKISC